MIEKKALTVPEAAEAIGISRVYAYQLVRAGLLPSIKLGKKWIVPVKQLDEWLDAQAGREMEC